MHVEPGQPQLRAQALALLDRGRLAVLANDEIAILDRATGGISYGRVPSGSVVVAGSLPSNDGKYSLYCAVIVKQVDEKTRSKTSVNELLRGAVE